MKAYKVNSIYADDKHLFINRTSEDGLTTKEITSIIDEYYPELNDKILSIIKQDKNLVEITGDILYETYNMLVTLSDFAIHFYIKE